MVQLGQMGYQEALEIQRAAAIARISGEIPEDVLFLVEHPPVVTLGRSAKQQSLVASRELIASRGAELFEVERGGDVTFHGPGQIVGYTIADLKRHRQDLHWFLRQIEEALIRTLGAYGIDAERDISRTGVWTNGRKIASIGLHARDWVTWHGFALNVITDLAWFDLIVPCGIDGVTMTSVANEIAAGHGSSEGPVTAGAAGAIAAGEFARVLGLRPAESSLDDLLTQGDSRELRRESPRVVLRHYFGRGRYID